MKIIKLPFETKIKCKCGCELEFDTEDITITERYSIGEILRELFVYCPVCKKQHIIKRVKDSD